MHYMIFFSFSDHLMRLSSFSGGWASFSEEKQPFSTSSAGFTGSIQTNTKSWQRKSFYWCRKEFHDLMDKYGSHSDTSSARTSPTHHLAGERSLPSLKQSWGTKISLGWSRVLYLKFLIWGEVYWRKGLKVRQNTHVPWGICVSVSPALKINILISTFNFK